MYISKLSIQGYKNTQKKSTISFNKGLNVLLGENGCGKTAVINALRLLLREPESNYACSPDDFYCSLDRSCVSDTIEIDAVLSEERVIGAISHHLGTIGISLPEITFRTPRGTAKQPIYQARLTEEKQLRVETIHSVKGGTFESVSITMTPEYYRTTLRNKYGDAYEDPETAVNLVDGQRDFPELTGVFHQIRSYEGEGMSARLFYESKVEQVLSLVLEYAKRPGPSQAKKERKASKEDIEALISVAAYISDRYQEEIGAGFLAQMACMSPAKLKYAFKGVYHTTIQQYIVAKRMTQAERLLRDTELPVAQIAELSGYKRLSSLSEMFRRHTGMTPVEYRNMHRKA